MKDNCYNRDIIQAFLDGELASNEIEKIACHVSVCADCSALLQNIEDQTAIAFGALDEQLLTLVPTERIRTNLYRAINEIEKPKKSLPEKIFGRKLNFANPLITAFASLLIVGGLFFGFWRNGDLAISEQASVSTNNSKVENVKANLAPIVQQQDSLTAKNVSVSTIETPKIQNAPSIQREQNFALNSAPRIVKAGYAVRKNQVKSASPSNLTVTSNENNSLVAGEETYLKTIASLKETVDKSKDEVLRPTERIAFEKDLATVNFAIQKMKAEVRRNPKNDAAKEMLRASYQNKIDMLTTVADNTQLVASLR